MIGQKHSYINKQSFNGTYRTNEQMLDDLAEFTKEYLKSHLFLPTHEAIDSCKEISHSTTYDKKFGSLCVAYKLIGYDEGFNHRRFLDDIKNKYIEYCKLYNKTLNSRDLIKLSKTTDMYTAQTVIDNFGSLSILQKECGFVPTVLGRCISDEESLELLVKLSIELGRVPFQTEVNECRWTPNIKTYRTKFGTYKNALKLAGLNVERLYVSEAGIRCNSWYELQIANTFEKYHILYLREINYKKVIPSFEKAYRFDFAFEKDNQTYYIEFFGITGVPSYDNKIIEKQEICRANSINLISLYPDDIYSKSYNEIYDLIMSKCQ